MRNAEIYALPVAHLGYAGNSGGYAIDKDGREKQHCASSQGSQEERPISVPYSSDQHKLIALDLAIAEFSRKSMHPGDVWQHAAKTLSCIRSEVKTRAMTQRKRVTPGQVFAQAARR